MFRILQKLFPWWRTRAERREQAAMVKYLRNYEVEECKRSGFDIRKAGTM